MNVADAIRTLRAIRRFEDRPIPEEVLERILDAARRAPSSMNEQRWAFILVTDRERLRALARVGRYADHLAGAAAAIALVTPDAADPETAASIAFDLGQCAQNLMLAAWEQGVGSVHAAVWDPALAQELLGYPDGYRCDVLFSLGYPRSRPRGPGRRRPLSELLHQDRWG